MATNDAVGSITAVDVNLQLAQRDKYVTRLDTYLDDQVKDLRHSNCMSTEILPGTDQVRADAPARATIEQTRLVAASMNSGNPRKRKGKANRAFDFDDYPAKAPKRIRRGKSGGENRGGGDPAGGNNFKKTKASKGTKDFKKKPGKGCGGEKGNYRR